MSAMGTAIAKRGSQVQKLNLELADMDRRIARESPWNAQGQRDEYQAQRIAAMQADRDALAAELARIEALTGDDLVQEFAPPIQPVASVPLGDLLGRGEGPRPVVVHREPAPVRRINGDPQPANYAAMPKGWAPGETFYGDYSSG